MEADSAARLQPFGMASLELSSKRMSSLSPCCAKKAYSLGTPGSKNARNTDSNGLARHHNIPNVNGASDRHSIELRRVSILFHCYGLKK